MIHARRFGIVVLGLVASTYALHGQEPTHYRDFRLGSSLTAVSALTGTTDASDVKVLHTRPALMQELQWRRGYDPTAQDPVKQILFSFYNDQLARLVIDYDRDRTAGMTDADMVEGISATYGSPLKPAVKAPQAVPSQLEAESGTSLGQWGDADYSLVLYRTTASAGTFGFRAIVSSPRLTALARTADVQAIRLDASEAPQRELARQKQAVDDARTSKEKARLANKAAFRP